MNKWRHNRPIPEPQPPVSAPTQWLSRVAKFFREPIVIIGLVALGVIGLIFEIKFPGSTFPGSVAAICFVLFFWAHSFVGEFAFQLRFAGPQDISHKAVHTCERFFLELQQVAADWLALTTTKTGAVYRLKGNPPQAHE